MIKRYKNIRSLSRLGSVYNYRYGFIGIGNHSIENLFPVLCHFQVFPTWICCASSRKVPLIEKKYKGVKCTTNIATMLTDKTIKGVFVSASPENHFSLAKNVLESGKSLFIEKPPCTCMQELEQLIEMEKANSSSVVMVALQKRYAPATNILQKRLKCQDIISYNYRYLIGSYPEGKEIYDLFIHPIDYVCFLFGKAEIINCYKTVCGNSVSYFIILKHSATIGILELSTAYSWKNMIDQLVINTNSGIFELKQMDELSYIPKQATILGVPLEKIFDTKASVQYLFQRNNSNPIMINNQIITQGYYNEIKTFLDKVENKNGTHKTKSSFESMHETYKILDYLHQL